LAYKGTDRKQEPVVRPLVVSCLYRMEENEENTEHKREKDNIKETTNSMVEGAYLEKLLVIQLFK